MLIEPVPPRADIRLPRPWLYAVLQWGAIGAFLGFGLPWGFGWSAPPDAGWLHPAAVGTLAALGLWIAAYGYWLSILFRAWKSIAGPRARMSPVHAVIGMAVPVFNLFWPFWSIVGLAHDARRFAAANPPLRSPVSPGLSLAHALLLLAGLLPLIGFGFVVIDLVVKTMLAFQWTALIRAVGEGETPEKVFE